MGYGVEDHLTSEPAKHKSSSISRDSASSVVFVRPTSVLKRINSILFSTSTLQVLGLFQWIPPVSANAAPGINASPGWPYGSGPPPFDGWPFLVFGFLVFCCAMLLARYFGHERVSGIGMAVSSFVEVYIIGDDEATMIVSCTQVVAHSHLMTC